MLEFLPATSQAAVREGQRDGLPGIGCCPLLMAGPAFLIFQALISFENLFNQLPHCMFIDSSWARLLMLGVVPTAVRPILNWNKKSSSNLLFVNIISVV